MQMHKPQHLELFWHSQELEIWITPQNLQVENFQTPSITTTLQNEKVWKWCMHLKSSSITYLEKILRCSQIIHPLSTQSTNQCWGGEFVSGYCCFKNLTLKSYLNQGSRTHDLITCQGSPMARSLQIYRIPSLMCSCFQFRSQMIILLTLLSI